MSRLCVLAAGLLAGAALLPVSGALSPARAGEAGNGDLTRFLPNDGNSVYQAKGLLRQWPPGGPKELWRVEVGWGKSAVVEAGGLAFTAGETDDKQWALCLDPLTGATRWKRLLLPKPNRHFERGPVTSPVIDGDRIYFIPYAIYQGDVWEMRCPIVCLKTDGEELWRADQSFWGTEASTPLVVGDTLYVGADNPQRVVLVALDKMTGALRWSVAAEPEKQRELGAPASLTYQVVDGVPQVIVATYGTRELLGVHAATGEVMWHYPYPADIIIGLVSTPVAVGRRLFVCGGEGKGRNFSACLEMRAVDGKIAFKELYVSTELQTNMFNTVAVYQDAVFGFGGNDRAGFLHCTNLADGRLLWREAGREWTNDRNLVIADGLLFALTRNDELVMAEASREAYRELGRVALGIELGRPPLESRKAPSRNHGEFHAVLQRNDGIGAGRLGGRQHAIVASLCHPEFRLDHDLAGRFGDENALRIDLAASGVAHRQLCLVRNVFHVGNGPARHDTQRHLAAHRQRRRVLVLGECAVLLGEDRNMGDLVLAPAGGRRLLAATCKKSEHQQDRGTPDLRNRMLEPFSERSPLTVHGIPFGKARVKRGPAGKVSHSLVGRLGRFHQ